MTLYNKKGKAAAYIENDVIWTFDGRAVAYLFQEAVYNFPGKQLGWFEKGWLRRHGWLLCFIHPSGICRSCKTIYGNNSCKVCKKGSSI